MKPINLSRAVKKGRPTEFDKWAMEQLRERAEPERTQWGCDGKHHGIGTPECPRELHDHHDEFCVKPTNKVKGKPK